MLSRKLNTNELFISSAIAWVQNPRHFDTGATVRDSSSGINTITAHHHHDNCSPPKIMHLLFSVCLAGVSLSLIQAQGNAPTILPYCAVSQLFHLTCQEKPWNNSWLTFQSKFACFKPSRKVAASPLTSHACAKTLPMLQCLTSAKLRLAQLLSQMVIECLFCLFCLWFPTFAQYLLIAAMKSPMHKT